MSYRSRGALGSSSDPRQVVCTAHQAVVATQVGVRDLVVRVEESTLHGTYGLSGESQSYRATRAVVLRTRHRSTADSHCGWRRRSDLRLVACKGLEVWMVVQVMMAVLAVQMVTVVLTAAAAKAECRSHGT